MGKRMTTAALADISRRLVESKQDGIGVGTLVYEDIPKLLAEIERLRSEIVHGLTEGIAHDGSVKIDAHGRKYSIDEIWRPIGRIIEVKRLGYDEVVTLGSQFGILTVEIERLRKTVADDVTCVGCGDECGEAYRLYARTAVITEAIADDVQS